MATSLRGRPAWWLAAATVSCMFAAPAARADALAEVRIVQLQLAPDGSFTEFGRPLEARSFSNGVVQADIDFFFVTASLGPAQRQSWHFGYTVSMSADGLPTDLSGVYPVCGPRLSDPCAPPVDGQSLAWTFFAIGDIDPRSMSPFASALSGAKRFEFTLRDGTFQQSGVLHLEAYNSSAFSELSGGFAVGALTFAAAIPEPATTVQIAIGLGLLAGVFARRAHLQRRPPASGAYTNSLSAAPPPAA